MRSELEVFGYSDVYPRLSWSGDDAIGGEIRDGLTVATAQRQQNAADS
jgi:hypothetical protein